MTKFKTLFNAPRIRQAANYIWNPRTRHGRNNILWMGVLALAAGVLSFTYVYTRVNFDNRALSARTRNWSLQDKIDWIKAHPDQAMVYDIYAPRATAGGTALSDEPRININSAAPANWRRPIEYHEAAHMFAFPYFYMNDTAIFDPGLRAADEVQARTKEYLSYKATNDDISITNGVANTKINYVIKTYTVDDDGGANMDKVINLALDHWEKSRNDAIYSGDWRLVMHQDRARRTGAPLFPDESPWWHIHNERRAAGLEPDLTMKQILDSIFVTYINGNRIAMLDYAADSTLTRLYDVMNYADSAAKAEYAKHLKEQTRPGVKSFWRKSIFYHMWQGAKGIVKEI